MKKEFLVPVTFEMCGMVAIQAETAEEAIQIANSHIEELPIPTEKEYVDGSYTVESEPEIVELYSSEKERHRFHPEHFTV